MTEPNPSTPFADVVKFVLRLEKFVSDRADELLAVRELVVQQQEQILSLRERILALEQPSYQSKRNGSKDEYHA